MLNKLYAVSKYIFIVSLILCIVLVIVAAVMAYASGGRNSTPYVVINGQKIYVEIASTPEKRTRGLSYRTGLPKNNGMLFVFESPESPVFWMKDMKFNLDIVFIREGKVVDVFENVPRPNGNEAPQTVSSAHEIDKALELPAGTVRDAHIKVGNAVVFSAL